MRGHDNRSGLLRQDRIFTRAHLTSKIELFDRWAADRVPYAEEHAKIYRSMLKLHETLEAKKPQKKHLRRK